MMPISFRVIPRERVSYATLIATPLATICLSLVSAAILLWIYNAPPLTVFYSFFIEPVSSIYSIGEVFIKASPLILIAQGLAIGFRAKIWNVGAEGQLIVGATFASTLPIAYPSSDSLVMLPAMAAVGAVAGMTWAAIAAALRTVFNASEIIVTLMLTEIAKQFLNYMVTGPLHDPNSFGWPQSIPFPDDALFSTFPGSRGNHSIFLTAAVSVICWLFVSKSFAAYRLYVGGTAPRAAVYAGFSEQRAIWLSLLVSGAAAGLAGVAEIAGPLGKLQPVITPGYGYAAIIAAFLGGLEPLGIILAGFFLAIIYVGGDNSLVSARIPTAAPAVMQGLLLVYYLAFSFLSKYSVRFIHQSTLQGSTCQTP